MKSEPLLQSSKHYSLCCDTTKSSARPLWCRISWYGPFPVSFIQTGSALCYLCGPFQVILDSQSKPTDPGNRELPPDAECEINHLKLMIFFHCESMKLREPTGWSGAQNSPRKTIKTNMKNLERNKWRIKSKSSVKCLCLDLELPADELQKVSVTPTERWRDLVWMTWHRGGWTSVATLTEGVKEKVFFMI